MACGFLLLKSIFILPLLSSSYSLPSLYINVAIFKKCIFLVRLSNYHPVYGTLPTLLSLGYEKEIVSIYAK